MKKWQKEQRETLRNQAVQLLDQGAVLIGRALEICPEDFTGLRKEMTRLSNDADKLCGDIEEGRYTE